MKSFVSLINHASIFVSNGYKSILTDPWYFGDAFDDGWNLLFENKEEEILKILNQTNYIWISHEHPDHFSIPFYKKYFSVLKNNKIEIFFQKTKDKRVVGFLKSLGLSVIELSDGDEYEIEKDFTIITQRSDFYDSALVIKIKDKKIFNLNDCPMSEVKDILEFKKKYGKCDYLFSQFSYAAWKGGEKNLKWRRQAADEKIKTIINQSNILEAKYTLPFASFVYFSNNYNFYLNDSMNSPKKILDETKNQISKYIFLKPYEKIYLSNPEFKNDGATFWNEEFKNISLKKRELKKYSFDELNNFYIKYVKRMFKKNSYILCKILSIFKFLKIFQPLVIKLSDIDKTCEIDVINKKFMITDKEPDIEMHSKSLKLIFTQDYGFDTLTINGCFEEIKTNGFVKLTQSLALGNLNNLGIYLNGKIFFNISVILLFLKKLIKVRRRLNYKSVQEFE